jgi:septum formation protein
MLYLASKSPRRKLLLSKITSSFRILDTDIEEIPKTNETPQEYIVRVARDKAYAARKLISNNELVMAADTEVILNGSILGKPADTSAAISMLEKLSNTTHEVITVVIIIGDELYQVINTNRVTFRKTTKEERLWYCENFSPLDKAGAYGIQDAAAAFIDRFEGSYSGVMGLPLYDTHELLIKSGVSL